MGSLKYAKVGLCVLLISLPVSSWAGELFENLRHDMTVPEKCQTTQIEHFNDDIEFFAAGITGAKSRGFDYEYAIERNEVRLLWDIFLKDLHHDESYMNKVRQSERLSAQYQILLDNYEIMDFEFSNEGAIFELLAIVDLKKQYDDRYFITGSVAYHSARNPRTIGELDLVIALADSCEVIAVGEAKAGKNGYGKARKQLQRFRGFLSDQLSYINSFMGLDALALPLANN